MRRISVWVLAALFISGCQIYLTVPPSPYRESRGQDHTMECWDVECEWIERQGQGPL